MNLSDSNVNALIAATAAVIGTIGTIVVAYINIKKNQAKDPPKEHSEPKFGWRDNRQLNNENNITDELDALATEIAYRKQPDTTIKPLGKTREH